MDLKALRIGGKEAFNRKKIYQLISHFCQIPKKQLLIGTLAGKYIQTLYHFAGWTWLLRDANAVYEASGHLIFSKSSAEQSQRALPELSLGG